MKIGEALKEVLDGLTFTTPKGKDLTLNFHYGDQKELNHFLYIKQRNGDIKYPLAWYVISDEQTMATGKRKATSQLIIFAKSVGDWLNTSRAKNSYYDVVDPVQALIEQTLRKHKFITILNAPHGLPFKDEPNYGVEVSNQSDFSSTGAKGTKAITVDILDARILKIELIINTDCIIPNT